MLLWVSSAKTPRRGMGSECATMGLRLLGDFQAFAICEIKYPLRFRHLGNFADLLCIRAKDDRDLSFGLLRAIRCQQTALDRLLVNFGVVVLIDDRDAVLVQLEARRADSHALATHHGADDVSRQKGEGKVINFRELSCPRLPQEVHGRGLSCQSFSRWLCLPFCSKCRLEARCSRIISGRGTGTLGLRALWWRVPLRGHVNHLLGTVLEITCYVHLFTNTGILVSKDWRKLMWTLTV